MFILLDGTVKLLDFGIAKLATSTLTRQGDVIGSAPYMSPEQIAGAQDLDGRSDVWSTGVLLYELLTGRKPFPGEELTTVIAGILREKPRAIEELVPGLPQALIDTVSKALEKDRDRRYRSAEELGRELQLIRKTHQLTPPPPMEETRFASTNVLKALHDDRQKQDQPAGSKTLQQPPPAAVAPSAGGSKTWMIAAGVVVAIVAIGGGYIMTRPAPPSPQLVPQPSAPSRAADTPTTPTEKAAVPDSRVASAEKPPAPTRKATTEPARPLATPPATSPASAPAPPTRAVMVPVTMSAAYPFEVFDGARVISPAATSHELQQPNGKTLRVVAAEVFLDRPVKIDGSADQKFEYSPPGLGRIVLRAQRGDCKATIGKSDLGFGPWPKPIPAAAGDYQITLVCPDGQNPVRQTTVTQGLAANVFFTK